MVDNAYITCGQPDRVVARVRRASAQRLLPDSIAAQRTPETCPGEESALRCAVGLRSLIGAML